MHHLQRREWLQLFGMASLGLGLSSFSPTLSGASGQEMNESQIKRLLYNENPYGPSRKARKRIIQNLDRSNRYATFHKYDLNAIKQLIARQEGLKPGNILLGHGSFELLTWLAVHFGVGEGEIIVPSPTFDVVGNIGRKIGARVISVEVDDDFKMNLTEMEERMTSNTRLVTLCNPNNPTGTSIDKAAMTSFCKRASKRCPVLIDEAYIHYLPDWRKQSMGDLIAEGENILIARTFSKIYGMAGLRVGFLMGPEKLIAELESKFTMGFPGNMPNSLSIAAAMEALKDHKFVDASRELNNRNKTALYEVFQDLSIQYLPSDTNFVYFDVGEFASFRSFMRKNDIVLAGGWPTKSNWARVTIGTEKEMEYFVDKVKTKGWL